MRTVGDARTEVRSTGMIRAIAAAGPAAFFAFLAFWSGFAFFWLLAAFPIAVSVAMIIRAFGKAALIVDGNNPAGLDRVTAKPFCVYWFESNGKGKTFRELMSPSTAAPTPVGSG